MMETLAVEMNCGDFVESRRCALTAEQVASYDLPTNPDALKDTDTRAAKYRAMFGDLAVELDAIPPATLEGVIEDCIRESLDLSELQAEREQQDLEVEDLAVLRSRVLGVAGIT